jgi:hypothetical protein
MGLSPSETKACKTWLSIGVAGARHADATAGDEATSGLDAGDAARVLPDAGHFAVLQDVDAEAVSRACKAPGHRIMAHRAAATLQQAAHDREACVVEIREWKELAHLLAVEHLGIDAVQVHRVAAARALVALRIVVEQVQHAALADHRVVVEVLLQAFPQLERVLVEGDVAGHQVVRADDRGVAADVAAADVPLLQHGHVARAVVLRQVIRRGETVAATADDDEVVSGLWLRVAPGRGPAAVTAQRFPQQAENRVSGCQRSPHAGACRSRGVIPE